MMARNSETCTRTDRHKANFSADSLEIKVIKLHVSEYLDEFQNKYHILKII